MARRLAKLRSFFRRFVYKNWPYDVIVRGQGCSLLDRLPMVDAVFPSGNILDRSFKLSKNAPNF